MMTVALAPKRLELLHELVPRAVLIAMLANPTSPYFERETRDVVDAARTLGRQVQVHVIKANSERNSTRPLRRSSNSGLARFS
jgi:putative ABC transport system substrate-binding protein